MSDLWRISEFADLNGLGGLFHTARWHNKGRPIVYLADSPASSLLEILVNTPTVDLPDSLQLLRIRTDSLAISEPVLPIFWTQDRLITREIGDEWLKSKRTALLKVPSAIAPHCWNFLLNPDHSDAVRVRIVSVKRFKLDPRLR